MARKSSRSDLITGAFALLVIASTVAVVAMLQGVSPRVEGVRYTVLFEDVGGLGSSAPIVVAGQRVGKVDSITTLQTTGAEGARSVEVEVGFIISEEYADVVAIPVDSVAHVQMGSLFGFGGNQIVLKLGESREVVQPGQRLPRKGQPPVNLNDVVDDAANTVKKLQSGVDKLAAVLNDEKFIDNIEQAIAYLRSSLETLDAGLKELEPAFAQVGPTLTSADELIKRLRKLLEDNNAAIEQTLKHFESASGKLDKLLDEGGNGVPTLVSNLNTIANNLDALVANLNDVIIDNQLNIQISLENVRETTESLRVFARRIERDPSLLIWGGEDASGDPKTAPKRVTPGVDEMEIRNSGRRPRKESD